MQLPPAPPELPSPHKKLPNLRPATPVLAIVLIVVVLVGALQIVRGAANPKRVASGPAATATTTIVTTTATTTAATGTVTPGPTPRSTATSKAATWTANVQVTQNQDERQACIDGPKPYTVVLYNAGNVAANWHVNFPSFTGMVPGNPAAGPQPLDSPLSSTPYWASATPQDGSIAPGKSANVLITVYWPMPCGSTLYKAAVQLTFPSGGSQADLPLTFGGTGPAPYSNVVLASGSMNSTEVCPTSGAAPGPFTFAITNTGNSPAGSSIDESPYIGVNTLWAGISITKTPQESVPTLIYPNQVWTITVTPNAGVSCTGTPYYIYIQANNAQGTATTLTFTYTFTTS